MAYQISTQNLFQDSNLVCSINQPAHQAQKSLKHQTHLPQSSVCKLAAILWQILNNCFQILFAQFRKAMQKEAQNIQQIE
jgi:hypothetical protein